LQSVKLNFSFTSKKRTCISRS